MGDLSCRGYHLHSSDTVDNNYFVDGCSAKMLCCEPESAYPDPPIGGAEIPITPPQSPQFEVVEVSNMDLNVNIMEFEGTMSGKKAGYSGEIAGDRGIGKKGYSYGKGGRNKVGRTGYGYKSNKSSKTGYGYKSSKSKVRR